MSLFEIATFLRNRCENNQCRVHKLLYYAQGIYLGIYGDVLFDENIETYGKGPIIKEVFNNWDHLPYDTKNLDPIVTEFLQSVLNEFASFTTKELLDKIREEAPWKNNAFKKFPIPVGELLSFFNNNDHTTSIIKRLKQPYESDLTDLTNLIKNNPAFSLDPPDFVWENV